MTACIHRPLRQPAPSLGRRLIDGFWRHFRWPVLISRELVDQAWLDGLNRAAQDEATEGEATRERSAALDRTRRM